MTPFRIALAKYGVDGVLVADLNLDTATRKLALP